MHREKCAQFLDESLRKGTLILYTKANCICCLIDSFTAHQADLCSFERKQDAHAIAAYASESLTYLIFFGVLMVLENFKS